jgi:hypothetical protein
MVRKKTLRNACLITLFAAITACVFMIAGCASTQRSDLWVDPSYNAAPMNKVLVIAMRKNALRRRMWEDAMVSALGSEKQAGTVAVASYQLFPDNMPDTQAVRLRTNEEGFDGVLVVARAKRGTIASDVPGYVESQPVTTYRRKWNAYVTRYEDVYHPGYTEIDTTVSVRTDLLVPREDGKLVWSVTSQSVDPASADQFRNSVANGVAKQLKKNKIIY